MPGRSRGSRSRVGRGCRLILDSDARLILGDQWTADDHTTPAVYYSGMINLVPGSFVGHHCTIAARESVEIGAGTDLAELVSIRGRDHAVGASPGSE